MEDDRHLAQRLARHAEVLRAAAQYGCIRGSKNDASYRGRCRIRDRYGAVLTLTREIGRARSLIPIPVGHRALHLSIVRRQAVPQLVIDRVVAVCFRDARTTGDLVWMLEPGEVHVFMLCDEWWHSVTPPEWVRATAENDVEAGRVLSNW